MSTAKDEIAMKKNLLDAFAQSNKVFEASMSKMTDCLTSLGSGIASAMQMVAMALSGQPQSFPPNHGQYTGAPTCTCTMELESILLSFHMKLDHFRQTAITVQWVRGPLRLHLLILRIEGQILTETIWNCDSYQTFIYGQSFYFLGSLAELKRWILILMLLSSWGSLV